MNHAVSDLRYIHHRLYDQLAVRLLHAFSDLDPPFPDSFCILS
jgi:hypothetical protein